MYTQKKKSINEKNIKSRYFLFLMRQGWYFLFDFINLRTILKLLHLYTFKIIHTV